MKRGFTLVEAMVALAVLAIFAAVAIPAFMNRNHTSKLVDAILAAEEACSGDKKSLLRIQEIEESDSKFDLKMGRLHRLTKACGKPSTIEAPDKREW